MKNVVLSFTLLVSLAACGAAPISKQDHQSVRQGEKALLVTNNRQLSDYLYIIPIVIDLLGGQPNQINIEAIDGNEIEKDWQRVNQKIVLEPGKHVIRASCAVEVTSMNRDVNDTSDDDIQWSTDFIDYEFKGGKKYRIYAQEHINATCTMGIEEMR